MAPPQHRHDSLWESGYDEPVEVNQRALIDKVLARYSAEFTVFRELLQNSDDARSTAVEIHFETVKTEDSGEVTASPSKLPDLKNTLVHRWVFKNNGQVFAQADWSRLKKIADGNPDEDKIGAFGVGFYSLFSETDEPRVRSGDQWMCFYWKDGQDQLYVRRGKDTEYSHDAAEQWTTFEMPLRDPSPLPAPFDLARFLASSITFMTHLSNVSVFLDDHRLVMLSKTAAAPKPLPFPLGINPTSPNSFMKAVSLSSKPLQIQANIMHGVYMTGTEKPPPPSAVETTKQSTSTSSSLLGIGRALFKGWGSSSPTPPVQKELPPVEEGPDPMSLIQTTISLSIYSIDIAVNLDRKLSGELLRATKKDPPARMRYELIYTGKDEYDASKKEDEDLDLPTGSVFQALRADQDRTGAARIFIGHATAQTTGIGGNMSARFIPTVEREQLDLSNKYVGDWNKELLYVGGLLCRAAYEIELDSIKTLWEAAAEGTSSEPHSELRTILTNRTRHILKFFTFYETTPQHEVRAILEQAFFRCSPRRFPIMSTLGIRDATQVLMPEAAYLLFLKETAFLPESLVPKPGEYSMVNTLRQAPGWLKPIGPEHVIQELSKRPLNEVEMIACLQWWITVSKQGVQAQNFDPTLLLPRLLEVAILNTGPPTNTVLPMAVVKRFLIRRGVIASIPTECPLPQDLLPLSISQKLKPEDLKACFHWHELTLVAWLTFVVSEDLMKSNPNFDITTSAPWALQLFSILARAWSSLSRADTETVASLLRDKSCIPTTVGMRKPTEAYFSNFNVFKDLPMICFPPNTLKGQLEQVLLAVGVRKHMDVEIVFDRMVKTNEWNAPELAKYFASVRNSLSSDEMDRLRVTPIFSSEILADSESTSNQSSSAPPIRYMASQLHEPTDVLRQMKLPILNWGQAKWKPSSEEAKFLYSLGLRRQPELGRLIKELCTNSDLTVRAAAFKYLLDNVETRYKDLDVFKFGDVAFIPALRNGRPVLAQPLGVATDRRWEALGFTIVNPEIQHEAQNKLKLKHHPSAVQLINLLSQTPPKDPEEAKSWFATLAGRVTDLSATQLRQLGSMNIVPVKSAGGVKYYQPTQCFFQATQQVAFHSALFVFVDFGGKANAFLTACGTQREPSVEQLAEKLLENPVTFYNLTGGPASYYRELSTIALRWTSLSTTTVSRLKQSPVLLASQRTPRKAPENDIEDEEENRTYALKTPGEVVIADDSNAYQLFWENLWTSPLDETLERFYFQLGSKYLSSLIKEEVKRGHEVSTGKSQKIRALVLERIPLFLHEHSHSSRTKITLSWLNADNNFKVRSFGTIQIAKTLQFGSIRATKTLSASAASNRARRNGPLELWIANNDEVDMFEVATALNRYIFEAPKANDALLFMTILSTDLRSLRRRGYNVDRILRQQNAQKEAERREREEQMKINNMLSEYQDTGISLPGSEKKELEPPAPYPNSLKENSSPSGDKDSHHQSLLQRLSAKLNKTKEGNDKPFPFLPSGAARASTSTRPEDSPTGPQFPGGFDYPPHQGPSTSKPSPGGKAPNHSQPQTKEPRVTPLSDISANVENAIRACRPESGHLIQNREQMSQVKESMNEGYCDISGQVGNLKFVGSISDVKIYTSEDVVEPELFVAINHEAMERLISLVLLPLATDVYGLPPKSVHVFQDIAGGTIAFNRNGSIFVNFRYYEAWHEAQVRQGQLIPVFISMFFTLAHELAHNLVQPHNAEHEFYFSAICEKHMMSFFKLISNFE